MDHCASFGEMLALLVIAMVIGGVLGALILAAGIEGRKP